ncbi:MAG: DUF4296 domain-containing protein [Mangrovibacterium sp.]
MKSFIVICMLLIFSSCNNSKINKPEHLPKPQVIEDVLYELHYADAIAQNHSNTPVTSGSSSSQVHLKNMISDSLYAHILQKYELTDSLLANALIYYSSLPKTYEEIYEKVIERMNNDLSKQIYTDSISFAELSEEKRLADSIAEAIKKQEADSIANVIYRHFVDSIASATNRDFNFVSDSLKSAEEELILSIIDSLELVSLQTAIDSIVKASGNDSEIIKDSLLKVHEAKHKLFIDSISSSISQQFVDSISTASKRNAQSVRDSLIIQEERTRKLLCDTSAIRLAKEKVFASPSTKEAHKSTK